MPSRSGRTLFVGREVELRRLHADFDAAATGQGSLALIMGESGIGKTTLCNQLAAHVTAHGGRVLTGHCYEEGSLSLPYLPFVEALHAYALAVEPERLRQELGAGAAEVARIVPELRAILGVEPGPPTDPESDRYRLLQAVTDCLRAIAVARPLLLVLEDLHDADRGTLDLLTHLRRHLDGARLLVAGTYRDIEVDRAHPLSGALAELRRAGPVERLHLRGLTPAEVRRWVDGLAERPAPSGLAEVVHSQTEGNPLFVQEVIAYLVEKGVISSDGGRLEVGGATALALSIPEGLRDVIGKRLSRLSADANRLLSVAAVLGREFSLATLEAVAGLADEALLAGLDEAVRAGVLEDRSRSGTGMVRYRFTHAFFRQTLYEELLAPRRIRLHQQVARTLEQQYAGRLSEHAAELADHFTQSIDPTDLAKAVQYGELAAQRAMSVYAFGEAARLLGQALGVQEVLDPDDAEKHCNLLLALGDALLPAGENERVAEEVAPAAFSLAEGLSGRARAAHACRLALDGLFRAGGGQAAGTPAYRRWADRADAYAVQGTVDRVYADWALGAAHIGRHEWREGIDLILRAMRLARDLDDPRALPVLGAWFAAQAPPRYWLQWVQLAQEIARWPRDRLGGPGLVQLLWGCGLTLLSAGEREQAEALWREVTALPARGEDALHRLLPLLVQTWMSMLDGQLGEVLATAKRVEALAEEVGAPGIGRIAAALAQIWALWLLGRPEEALAFLPDMFPAAGELAAAECLALAGRRAEAEELLARLVSVHSLTSPESETPWGWLVIPLRTALALGDRETAELLAARLAGPMDTAFDPVNLIPIASLLGDVAMLRGNRTAARAYYDQALVVGERVRSRTAIALTRVHLTELLVTGTPAERAEATQHLDFVIPEFQAMQMQPALDRARHARALLEAREKRTETRTFPDGLTPREVGVLRLIAAGRSNAEIAAALVLSIHTVERHIANLYAKIAAHGRADATAYAHTHDLV